MITRRRLSITPIVAVGSFVALYFVCAALYPGGTRADPSRVGFSFMDNYWCDVLDVTTYGGRTNPAAPLALGATVLLALGLAVLWWLAPTLFPAARVRAFLVRGAGVVSGLVTPLIATKHHDLVINVAVLAGALAFVITMTHLVARAREGRHLVVLGALAFAAATTNFVMWRTGWMLSALPLVQKGAFGFFLASVLAFALRVRRASL